MSAAVLVSLGVTLGACDLNTPVFSQIEADQFFQNEEEVLAALAPLYANLRTVYNVNDYHALSQVPTDETIIPTRGTDWGDGGNWLTLHFHEWTPTHPFVNIAWGTANTGIARANGLLSSLEGAMIPNAEATIAEVRVLRAFYYYILLDLFGRAPIIGDAEGEFVVDPNDLPPAEDRLTIFNFVETELLEARDALPDQSDVVGRVGKDVVDAMLASLYLNAEVWTGSVGAGGLQRGTPRWADAYERANNVIASGRYSLDPNWQANFTPDNEGNPEHIFVVQHLAVQGLGTNYPNRRLHYNSTEVGAWNGFSTIAETYNTFSEDDPRRDIMLIGQQVNLITGEEICERPGCEAGGPPLIFTTTFEKRTDRSQIDINDATESAGVRINKFPPDPAEVNGNHSNDFPIFRLAEMYLIRAEAGLKGNVPGSDPLGDVNTIRRRVGAPELASVDEAAILDERLFEFATEGKRRQDLIRASETLQKFQGGGNLFSRQWEFKENTDPFRVVFPIPQDQINANPALTQNAGY
ncbi:MAG: RagB/SusD family nutrient uptake outer membrane protein [Bacteroidota bacterium]